MLSYPNGLQITIVQKHVYKRLFVSRRASSDWAYQPQNAILQIAYFSTNSAAGDGFGSHDLLCLVLSRVVARALKIVASYEIMEQVHNQMPDGAIHAGEIDSVPAGDAVLRFAALRGPRSYE